MDKVCLLCHGPLPRRSRWIHWLDVIIGRPVFHNPKKYPECKQGFLRRLGVSDEDLAN